MNEIYKYIVEITHRQVDSLYPSPIDTLTANACTRHLFDRYASMIGPIQL